MKRFALVALVLLPLACATRQPGTAKTKETRGHGVINLTVTPDPIALTKVNGSTYEFPFDVVIKETGGHPVTIERVSANIYAGGGISVASQSFDTAKIQSLGFPTTIAAKAELHYHFAPRSDVYEALLTSVYGDVRVEAIDDNAARASSTAAIAVKVKK